jgi:hypothetical protein
MLHRLPSNRRSWCPDSPATLQGVNQQGNAAKSSSTNVESRIQQDSTPSSFSRRFRLSRFLLECLVSNFWLQMVGFRFEIGSRIDMASNISSLAPLVKSSSSTFHHRLLMGVKRRLPVPRCTWPTLAMTSTASAWRIAHSAEFLPV